MANKTGRNDPCPCGSGKKYKQCHLGLANDPSRSTGPSATSAPTIPLTEQAGWARAIPYAVGLIGGALSLLGFSVVNTQTGLTTLAATALVIGAWFTFGNPPPPKDDAGDPAGLNFGR